MMNYYELEWQHALDFIFAEGNDRVHEIIKKYFIKKTHYYNTNSFFCLIIKMSSPN